MEEQVEDSINDEASIESDEYDSSGYGSLAETSDIRSCRRACRGLNDDYIRCSDNCFNKYSGTNCKTSSCRYKACVAKCNGKKPCKDKCFYNIIMKLPVPKKKKPVQGLTINKLRNWRRL